MSSRAFKYIEQLLYDYPDYDTEIKRRRQELIYPHREQDENVGGGKSSHISRPQETIVVTLDADERLRQLERQQLVIKNELFKLSQTERNVIKFRYFDRPQTLTWDGVALETRYSVRQCFRARDKLIEGVGKRLGLL